MTFRFQWLIAVVLAAASSDKAHAVVVAKWQFDDGANFLNDSSGNGHHLTDAGIASFAAPTYSPDKPTSATGDGSAQFNGSTSFAQTVKPLDISRYDWVRFSYWMKVEGPTLDMMILENSFDTNFQVNTGSTFHLANASGVGGGGKTLIAHRTIGGFSSDSTTLDVGPAQTQPDWHFIQVEYDFLEPAADERIKLFVDGVEGSTLRPISGGHVWERLRDDLLYVGGRREFAGNPSLLFTGKLDDLTIEATPEPGTLTLLGIGAASLSLSTWRKLRRAIC